MYKKGNYVIKIPEGICEIEDVGCLDISGVNKDKEDRKSTRLNSSHNRESRMPSSA